MTIKKPEIKGLESLGVGQEQVEAPVALPSLKEVIDAVKTAYKEVGIEGQNVLLGILISMNDKQVAMNQLLFSQLHELRQQLDELKTNQKPKSSLITTLQ